MPAYYDFIPTPKQKEFLEHPAKYKLFGGGMGSGKSVVLCAEVLTLAIKIPKNRIIICRHEYSTFKQSTLIELEEMIPPEIIKSRNRTDGVIELINGSIIITTGLEKPDKLKSYNLGAFAIDEATETSIEIFNMLSTRTRLKHVPAHYRKGLLASNPEPGWVKERFVDPQVAGNPLPGHAFIQSLPRDNPHLPPDWEANLRLTLPPVWVQKYLEGSWDVHESQIFKPDHIKNSHPIPSKFESIIMALDPAITETEDTDFDESAICVIGIDSNNIIHEVETRHGRWGITELVDTTIRMYHQYNPTFFGVEAIAFQKAVMQLLQQQNIPCIPIKRDGDKARRGYAISYLFEDDRVRVNNQKLVKQLLEFPVGKRKGGHDDLADALIMALQMYSKFSTPINKTPPKSPLQELDRNSRLIWEDFQKSTKKNTTNQISNLYKYYYGEDN